MKILLTIALIISLTTCENDIVYDGQTRFMVESKIVDKDGKPISNLPVTIDFSSGYSGDQISQSLTNKSGTAIQFFPFPVNDIAKAAINIGENTNYIPLYNYNIRKSNFLDYKLSFQNIVLYKVDEIAELKLIFNQISTKTAIRNIKVEGEIVTNSYDFNVGTSNEWSSNFNYTVVKNQTLILKYSIVDNSQPSVIITDFVKEIVVQNDPIDYTITY
jgi:hypothetical protein